MQFLRKNLFLQVVIAMILGILVGLLFPQFGLQLKILATIFIRLIKMVIAPIIFISIVLGINSHKHGNLGRLALRTLVYFEIMSIVATLLTYAVFAILKPGIRVALPVLEKDLSQLSIMGSNVSSVAAQQPDTGLQSFLVHIIPDNFFGTLTSDNFISIVILAVLFAVAILNIPNSEKILNFFSEANRIFFRMINFISYLSPYAAFGAMAALVGHSGLASLHALSYFVGALIVSMVLFCALLFVISYCYGFSPFKLMVHIKAELMVALGTSSSESIFPQLMQKLTTFGCSQKTVGFVLPTGYAFNLDGTAIYITAGIFFIQQTFNIPLSVTETIIILSTILVVSKGAAGVAGAGFITLSAVLMALPNNLIPVEGLALLLGIDRLMSDARTITNVIGNSIGTVIIAKAENEFT